MEIFLSLCFIILGISVYICGFYEDSIILSSILIIISVGIFLLGIIVLSDSISNYCKEEVIVDYLNGNVKIDTLAISPKGDILEVKIYKY